MCEEDALGSREGVSMGRRGAGASFAFVVLFFVCEFSRDSLQFPLARFHRERRTWAGSRTQMRGEGDNRRSLAMGI